MARAAQRIIPDSFQEPQTWRWFPPGVPCTIQEFEIADGMVYVGRSMKAMSGYGVEPSLINPAARVARSASRGSLFDYFPSYAAASPGGRHTYLKWLAGGRKEPLTDERCLMLFFYGIERRLFEHGGADLHPGESDKLCAEVRRLQQSYPDIGYFQNYAAALLHFLDLSKLLQSDDLPSVEPFFAMAKRGRIVPPALDVALARMCARKIPLSADYALAWYLLDPETAQRVAATRCPEEMRALFQIRYHERFPNGIKLSSLRTRLSLTYYPASRGFGMVVSAPMREGESLLRVSLSPLKAIREIGYACAEELGAYARRVAKEGSDATRLTTAATLPTPLFVHHPAVRAFGEWLSARAESGGRSEGAELLQAARGSDDLTPPGKAECTVVLEAAEKLGYAMEPDVRLGGAPFTAAAPVFVAPVPPLDAAQKAAFLLAAPVAQAVVTLARPEVGVLTGGEEAHVYALVAALARAGGDAECTRLVLRAKYILHAPDAPKVLRKIGAEWDETDRARAGEILIRAVSLRPENITPAKTKELARLFRVLGLEDTALYGRLHHAQTAPDNRRIARDGMVTVQEADAPIYYALPHAAGLRPTTRTAAPLDMEEVRRKHEESAQVAALLSDIFAEEAAKPTHLVPVAPDTVAPLRALISSLQDLSEVSRADFAALCKSAALLPGGAYEAINESAFEEVGDPALEGDDPITVNGDILTQLLAA